ncbi:hypothetical protein WJX81_005612 [Elliptochloris bilobata]|uniref:FCP1 homology domain-containing protein n=1 Tax=Elliptochloris bilobata TaxID=381761 RepID=A0AAW1SK40_9CHLO
MAVIKYCILALAIIGAASASRLELNGITEVMQEVGQEVEGYMTSIFSGKDRPDKDAEVVFLTKFIVTPDIALDFIAAVKKVKAAALETDGVAIYALSKTKSDNLIYYSYVAWKDVESVKEHLKGEAVKEFIKYTAKEKIPVFTTPLTKRGQANNLDQEAIDTGDDSAAADVRAPEQSVITQVTNRAEQPPPAGSHRYASPAAAAASQPAPGWRARLRALLCCFRPDTGEYARGEAEAVVIRPPQPPTPPRFTGEAVIGPLPDADAGRKTLVLDLDETLVHSSFKPIPDPDYIIPVEIEGRVVDVYVLKRPWCDQFLAAVGPRFEVIVFTASLAKYADPLLDLLDKGRVVRWRLFREACCPFEGNYVKDLHCLGRPLADSIIVDNSPHSYVFQPDNAVPIGTFIDNMDDRELMDILPVLLAVEKVADVRQHLGTLITNLHQEQRRLGNPAYTYT